MLDAIRIETSIKPNVIESLGDGYYYYNYDIQSKIVDVPDLENETTTQETRWDFVQVKINGIPNYQKCARAVIRAYVNSDSEFDLMNSFNAYQLGITDSAGEDYEKYLQLLQEIKEKVGKDFNRQANIAKSYTPRQADVVKLMLMTINIMSLDDQQSLEVKSLYPTWESFIGQTVEKDVKLQYNDKLFKVVQQHLVQQQYPPSIDTASLYTEIVEDHAGTLEDPIPYPADGNMIIYNGKYYIENDIIYLCIRDSQQPLYTALSTVVDNYVQVVEQ